MPIGCLIGWGDPEFPNFGCECESNVKRRRKENRAGREEMTETGECRERKEGRGEWER